MSKLNKTLEETARLLESVGEKHWSSRMRGARAKDVRSWFGGMGSINDLVLTRKNGLDVREEDEADLNRRFDELRKKLWIYAD